MKIVINRCYGGYSLSKEAYDFLGLAWDNKWANAGYAYIDDRANPELVNCVSTIGEKANGAFSALRVVEIPDDVDWEIEEQDGCEWIAEKHRVWYE